MSKLIKLYTLRVQFFVDQLYLSKVKAGFVFYYSKGFYLH